LFVIVDLFMNIEDFTAQRKDFEAVVKFVGVYYGYKSFQIFDRLCEAIVLLAGMFTVAWMQRNNELVPLLSAGVSTRRAVQPVLICAFLMMGLVALNQEFALPNIDIFMLENRQNPNGEQESEVRRVFDANKILFSGRTAVKKDGIVKDAAVNIPPSIGRSMINLYAREAHYLPEREGDQRSGGWLLKQTTPAELPNWPADQEHILKPLGDGEYLLKLKDVDLETVTRVKNWYQYLPTWKLLKELDRTDAREYPYVAMNFHTRLTRPLVGIILVLLGLSVILRDQNRNVFISAGLCLALCIVYFGTLFACQHLGMGHLPPALAAWIPVFVFGPVSVLMYAEVHT
jgi:lipopolysaccharide export system permease protein